MTQIQRKYREDQGRNFNLALMVLIIFFLLFTAKSFGQCNDFDGLAPAMGLHSSYIDPTSSWEGLNVSIASLSMDYLTYATDGAVIVYRSSDPTTLEAARLYDAMYLWRFETGDSIASKPLIERGFVFFGSDDGYFYALDERSGELIWKYDGRREETFTEKIKKEKKKSKFGINIGNIKDQFEEVTKTEYVPNDIRACPALIGNILAVFIPPNKIVGLNYLTGEKLWERELLEEDKSSLSKLLPDGYKQLFELPVHKIDILNDRFIINMRALFSLDPKTGDPIYFNRRAIATDPSDNSDLLALGEYTRVGDNILALTADSSLTLFDGTKGGIIWQHKFDNMMTVYGSVYAEEDLAYVLMPHHMNAASGIVAAFDVKSGEMQWEIEVENPSHLWFGDDRFYIVYNMNNIRAIDRTTHDVVWNTDLTNFGITRLYNAWKSLIFGWNTKNEIVVLCTESAAYDNIWMTAYAADPAEPAFTVQNVLEKGYPECLSQFHSAPERFADIVTAQAVDSIRKRKIMPDSIVHYTKWLALSQEKNDSTASVDVLVQLDYVEKGNDNLYAIHPQYDTLTFNLIKSGQSWIIDWPSPAGCQIDTNPGMRLLPSTPGVKTSLGTQIRSKNDLVFFPDDAWEFECVSDECSGSGTIRVEDIEYPQPGMKKLRLVQEFFCGYEKEEDQYLNDECSFGRVMFISYDSTKFYLQLMDVPQLGVMEFSLPLEDGAVFQKGEDYEASTCRLKVIESKEGEKIYHFSISAVGPVDYSFTISPQKGFLSYKHSNFDINSKWKMTDYNKF